MGESRRAKWQPRVTGGVIRCGRCGRRYSNPLTHVCVTRLDKPRRRGKTKLKTPSVALWRCANCKRRYSNPLTHVCKPRSDFRTRKREYQKQQRAAARKKARPVRPLRAAHAYQLCRDEDCTRYGCRVYREGYANGRDDGQAAGYAAGYSVGHTDGFAAGAASAGGRN